MPKRSVKKRPFDIREYKKALRIRYRKIRTDYSVAEREKMDRAIFHHVVSMPKYTICSTVLCYVSMKEEINTHLFIEKCLKDGKIVGVPYCVDNSREMEFYKITSLNELVPRTYGVLEPVAKEENRITDFSDSICLLPGISFDHFGYRLGYGGGYYDRFLSKKYDGLSKIGVCYSACIRPKLIHGRYDIPCDYIVSEKQIRKRAFPRPEKKKKRGKGSL